MIGHYISSYSVKRKTEILFYVLGMISAVLTIIATVVISKKMDIQPRHFMVI